MSQPFIGEIRIFAGNFAPSGWMSCEGQILAIAENEALFSLIGTFYGGDGQQTFALPDLRGRLPVHQGNGYVVALQGGSEEVTLVTSQIPAHGHALQATGAAAQATAGPAGSLLASANTPLYAHDGGSVPMASAVTPAGGSQPHDNVAPFLCVNFIISLFGIYPTQS